MCYNCGCQDPNDDMGDINNITNTTLNNLSKSWNKPLSEVKQIVLEKLQNNTVDENPELVDMFEKASKAWGQSVADAKKQTQDLLTDELKK